MATKLKNMLNRLQPLLIVVQDYARALGQVANYEIEAIADLTLNKGIIFGITGDKPWEVEGRIVQGFDVHIHTHLCTVKPSPSDFKFLSQSSYRFGVILKGNRFCIFNKKKVLRIGLLRKHC